MEKDRQTERKWSSELSEIASALHRSADYFIVPTALLSAIPTHFCACLCFCSPVSVQKLFPEKPHLPEKEKTGRKGRNRY
ncbi:MAG: hypothetical protein IJW07_01205 [Lentisphaeria bacterium]|nr:hypothetical protein [Lentisphaeria bacterium]